MKMNLEPRTSNVEHSTPHLGSRTSHVGVFVLLAVLTGLAYANSLQAGFVGDDDTIVVMNHGIRSLKGLSGLLMSDYWGNYGMDHETGPHRTSGLYRPLTMATYAVNYALGGLNPIGYHLGNLLLHLVASWLLYLVALRVGLAPESAVVAAAVFAAHPLHTEAVTGVVGRAELLMAAGVLGAMWGHLSQRRGVALVSFAVGLLAKEQAMVLPVVLLLYEGCVVRNATGRVAWRNWADWSLRAVRSQGDYFAVLSGYLAVRAAVLGGFPLPSASSLENPLVALSGLPWVLTVMKVAGLYAALFVWPASLVADYSAQAILPAHSIVDPAVLWGLSVWGGLVGLAIWAFARTPRVFFSSILCLVFFAPTANLFVTIGTIMAERLFYLPSAGLCLLVGLGYERLTMNDERGMTMNGVRGSRFEIRGSSFIVHRSSLVVQGLVVVVCLALTVRTVVRNRDWQDGERLFRVTIDAVPANAKAYVWLGGILSNKGQQESAIEAYNAALRLNPDYLRRDAQFNFERSGILFKLGRFAEALEASEQAVTLKPKWGEARNQLGLMYAALGNFDKAEAVVRHAIPLRPESPDLRSSLSFILNERGRYQEALMAAEEALQRDPVHPWGLVNRAIALEGLNRPEEAKATYKQVLSLSPGPEYRPALDEAILRLEKICARSGSTQGISGLIQCK